MNPDPLDELLRSYAEQPLPPSTSINKAKIWQRIGKRRQGSWSALFPVIHWGELFREPKLAIAGLAVALVIGSVPVATAATLGERPRHARDSLHLRVFTMCPSCLSLDLAATSKRR
jgi:hypothetical protein